MVSEPTRSFLLTGDVRHRRARPTTYDFTHGVWYLEFDLDDLASVTGRLRLLATEERGVACVRARDHLGGSSESLANGVRDHLTNVGVDASSWRISLVTYPRVMGLLFNPVSFYLCRDESGQLQHVIAEVNNTHGDRALYDFPRRKPGPVLSAVSSKKMYVSPFIGADARYVLSVADSAAGLVLSITEEEGDSRTLFARIQLRRRPLSDAGLARALIKSPFISVKTVGLIAWHAVRLRLLGLRWTRYGAARAPREG